MGNVGVSLVSVCLCDRDIFPNDFLRRWRSSCGVVSGKKNQPEQLKDRCRPFQLMRCRGHPLEWS